MSQIQVTKAVGGAILGPNSDQIAAPRAVAYLILIPGEEGDPAPVYASVYSNITRRLRR